MPAEPSSATPSFAIPAISAILAAPLVFALPGNEAAAGALCAALHPDAALGEAVVRRFPDGESYVRAVSAVRGRRVVLVCTLDRPDDKLVPLLLLAAACRDNGAASVGLVAPYLAYMRQDKAFNAGETISARHVARWLSDAVDWLVTVDPHLHRIHRLDEVYSIPGTVVHAADSIAAWLHAQRDATVLIGPDEESAQWVADVAQRAQRPFIVLEKTRRGDRDVSVSVPDVARWRDHVPVLVDDIISTARTMIETVRHVRGAGMRAPWCIGVHAVFAQSAYADLQAAGAAQVITCDTIAHASNGISVVPALADAARGHLRVAAPDAARA